MIVLITGASHTGKTCLAQRILERFGYPYLSIDHLKMGLIRSGQTSLTPEDDEELTAYLWPIVREIMKTAIENRQNLVMEGCYIPFAWRRSFDRKELESIRFLCLVMTERYIDTHLDDILRHASEIEERLDDADCTKDRLKKENADCLRGFREAGEEVTLIDDDYERTVTALIRAW